MGDFFNTILTYPILNLMVVLYHVLFDNLGLAIIAIAVISRLALIPLTKQQTEMTRKMSQLKPELDKLQKKYASNPQKLSEEQMKLYKKVGYNPLGCIGSMIPQLIILSVLIGVVRALTNNNFEGLYDFVKNWAFPDGNIFINTRFLFWDLARQFKVNSEGVDFSSIKEFYNNSPKEILRLAQEGIINNDQLSLFYKLGIADQYGYTSIFSILYLILAVVVGLIQFVTTKLTTILQNPESINQKKKKDKKKTNEPNMEAMQQNMQGSMMIMFPIMTIFISISAPAALGIYWIVQSIMVIAQYFILDFDRSKKGVQNLFTQMKGKLSKK
ncbi:MAG: YidC/Oxa1 family membrane protein insertase [Candidatus Dojkabacteria bacterium]|nr:YidC/Oxa1 family membrane protein insertase [Candidatus Dojkabacteria bacterium]